MRAVTSSCLLAALATFAAAPAFGVGLGPLSKEGVTFGPAKAFYLTLSNPYREAESFDVSAVSFSGEPESRVRVHPDKVRMGGRQSRKLIVVVGQLKPGETHSFKVCAFRSPNPEDVIRAQVCSKLTARRLGSSTDDGTSDSDG